LLRRHGNRLAFQIMVDTSSVAFRAYVAAEDHARANLYALISRLFASPPDATLIKAIASSPPLSTEDEGAPLPTAWSKLIAASSIIDEEIARDEYDALFGGVGKAQINLHASHQITGFMMETPLSDLRNTLASLGVARQPTQHVVEDHLSALCETMRLLIVGAEHGTTLAPASVTIQKDFFNRHIAAWVQKCCTAIVEHSLANYYVVVAEFAGAFFQVEEQSFDI
jgi:TorA maturation chaperone TorD